jgi:hypothetical protein
VPRSGNYALRDKEACPQELKIGKTRRAISQYWNDNGLRVAPHAGSVVAPIVIRIINPEQGLEIVGF